MSAKVEYGSGLSQHPSSKKSLSTKQSVKSSSNSKSKSSSSKSPSGSKVQSNYDTNSSDSSNSPRTYVPSEPLIYYINNPMHSNPGFSAAYTNALTYSYGFPQDPGARTKLEQEIVVESQARVQGSIDGCERQMRAYGQWLEKNDTGNKRK